ncbi:MAG: hypothetical protein NTZ33_10250 [Bacteroidetes bacterium]|nr:hypothetical protein [Bacteroidota bacterium]
MKIQKSTIYIAVFSIIAVIILGSAYNYYRKLKQPIAPAVTAIPQDALVFAEFNNIVDCWNNNNKSNQIWLGLQKMPFFNKANADISFINNMINSSFDIRTILSSNKSYLSLHQINSDSLALLFLCNLTPTFDNSDIKKLLKNAGITAINHKKFKGESIYDVKASPSARSYYYSIYKGVFFGSFCEQLIEKCILQLDNRNSFMDDENFALLKTTAGKKVDANIYINYSNLAAYLSAYANKTSGGSLLQLADFARWTELDVFVKSNQLLLNGYTNAAGKKPSYLSIFADESTQDVQITKILPQNTILFSEVSFHNFATYAANYKKYLKENDSLASYEKEISSLNSLAKCNVFDNFNQWMGNEFAVAILHDDGNIAENTFVICRTTDGMLADSCLQAFSYPAPAVIDKKKNDKTEKTDKNKLQLPVMLKLMLGGACPVFSECWYEVAGDFVIFASSKKALNNYKDAISSVGILAASKDYTDYAANIPNKSNIYAYINLDLAAQYLMTLLKPSTVTNFRSTFPVLQGFQKLSLQISADEKRFYTSINLKYKGNDKIKPIEVLNPVVNTVVAPAEPQAVATNGSSLDAEMIAQPYIVKNTTENNNSIIAFDASNKMYMLTKDGTVKWKTTIDGKPKSDVFEVDALKNNKIQYLFNTENSIYLVDAKGNKMDGFPVKLSNKASSGLCLIDYEKKRDYRIVLACNDKRLYSYNIKGELIKDFKSAASREIVETPPQHIIFGGKDNIIVSDKSGNMQILDRKGNERLKLKTAVVKNPASKLYYDGKYLITNDKSNKLYYISTEGKVETKTFKNIIAPSCFVYEDFNNDGTKDFIFLSANELKVCKKDGTIIFSYKFNASVLPLLQFFANTKKGNLMVVLGKDNKQIYVFNKKGLMDESAAFKGQYLTDIAPLADKNQLNLVSGFGNKLLKYTFK